MNLEDLRGGRGGFDEEAAGVAGTYRGGGETGDGMGGGAARDGEGPEVGGVALREERVAIGYGADTGTGTDAAARAVATSPSRVLVLRDRLVVDLTRSRIRFGIPRNSCGISQIISCLRVLSS